MNGPNMGGDEIANCNSIAEWTRLMCGFRVYRWVCRWALLFVAWVPIASYAILFFGDHFVVRSLTCDDGYSSAAVSIDVCGALNPNSGKSGVCAMRRWRAPRKVCCSSNYLNWSWWLINRFHFTSINILGGINNNNSTSRTRKLAHSVTLRNGT